MKELEIVKRLTGKGRLKEAIEKLKEIVKLEKSLAKHLELVSFKLNLVEGERRLNQLTYEEYSKILSQIAGLLLHFIEILESDTQIENHISFGEENLIFDQDRKLTGLEILIDNRMQIPVFIHRLNISSVFFKNDLYYSTLPVLKKDIICDISEVSLKSTSEINIQGYSRLEGEEDLKAVKCQFNDDEFQTEFTLDSPFHLQLEPGEKIMVRLKFVFNFLDSLKSVQDLLYFSDLGEKAYTTISVKGFFDKEVSKTVSGFSLFQFFS